MCRFHRIKRKQKEREMRKELERVGVAVEETEPLLRQRAMVGGGPLGIRWHPPDPLQSHMIASLLWCVSACVHDKLIYHTIVVCKLSGASLDFMYCMYVHVCVYSVQVGSGVGRCGRMCVCKMSRCIVVEVYCCTFQCRRIDCEQFAIVYVLYVSKFVCLLFYRSV